MCKQNKIDVGIRLAQVLAIIVATVIITLLIVRCEPSIKRMSIQESKVINSIGTKVISSRNISEELLKYSSGICTEPFIRDKVSIKIQTPNREYELTDLNLKCNKFSSDNNLWYSTRISPYLSPGIGCDVFLRGDINDDHWIKIHVVNTTNKDATAADCTVFTIGINGLEGYTINGVTVDDDMDNVITKLGEPTRYSLSDYNILSGATYDYGDYEINIAANIFTGRVEYIESVCKSIDRYSNGK